MSIKWETTTDYTTGTTTARPTYDGMVLGTTGRVERIMSDVWEHVTYARVWDGERIAEVAISVDGFSRYGTATVDATEAVRAAALAFEAAQARVRQQRETEANIDRQVSYAKALAVGKDVTVVRGRKIKIGTTGRIFWCGDTQYGQRVGIETTTGARVFTAATNVEVTHPDEYLDVAAMIASRA